MEFCCPQWDQRIPNEPIYQRNFMIEHPPVIHWNRPQDQACTHSVRSQIRQDLYGEPANCKEPSILMNPELDQESEQYWREHNCDAGVRGLKIRKHKNNMKNNMKNNIREPNIQKPWIAGVKYNIHAESDLRNLHYYNPQDCLLNTPVSPDSDLRLLKAMQHESYYLNETPRMFNNQTRMVSIEPIDFDYKKFLHSCCSGVSPLRQTQHRV